MSYNVSLFVLGFIFPMAVVIYCNIKIILMIKSIPDNVIYEAKSMKRTLYERQLTVHMVIYVGINIHPVIWLGRKRGYGGTLRRKITEVIRNSAGIKCGYEFEYRMYT